LKTVIVVIIEFSCYFRCAKQSELKSSEHGKTSHPQSTRGPRHGKHVLLTR